MADAAMDNNGKAKGHLEIQGRQPAPSRRRVPFPGWSGRLVSPNEEHAWTCRSFHRQACLGDGGLECCKSTTSKQRPTSSELVCSASLPTPFQHITTNYQADSGPANLSTSRPTTYRSLHSASPLFRGGSHILREIRLFCTLLRRDPTSASVPRLPFYFLSTLSIFCFHPRDTIAIFSPNILHFFCSYRSAFVCTCCPNNIFLSPIFVLSGRIDDVLLYCFFHTSCLGHITSLPRYYIVSQRLSKQVCQRPSADRSWRTSGARRRHGFNLQEKQGACWQKKRSGHRNFGQAFMKYYACSKRVGQIARYKLSVFAVLEMCVIRSRHCPFSSFLCHRQLLRRPFFLFLRPS